MRQKTSTKAMPVASEGSSGQTSRPVNLACGECNSTRRNSGDWRRVAPLTDFPAFEPEKGMGDGALQVPHNKHFGEVAERSKATLC